MGISFLANDNDPPGFSDLNIKQHLPFGNKTADERCAIHCTYRGYAMRQHCIPHADWSETMFFAEARRRELTTTNGAEYRIKCILMLYEIQLVNGSPGLPWIYSSLLSHSRHDLPTRGQHRLSQHAESYLLHLCISARQHLRGRLPSPSRRLSLQRAERHIQEGTYRSRTAMTMTRC